MSADQVCLPEGVPSLTTFYLYLTSGCNLACRHCWITPNFTQGRLKPDQYLDVELLHQAILTARPMGLGGVKLTGGEPVLHPDFVAITRLLTEQNLPFQMETNGTLIDAGLARYLKEETGLWFVSVSLDGCNPATHDRFRGVAGSFDAAVAGIKHLVDAGFAPQIIMSPHHGNLDEVEGLVELALRLGAGSVKFNPVTRSGRGIAMHERGETLDYDEVREFGRYLDAELQPRSSIPLHLGLPLALSSLQQLALRAGQKCNVRNILGILGSGEMALCGIGRNVPELCFGRLGEDDLREVWIGHPVLRQLRRDLEEPYRGICGDCIHARVCQLHCVAMNYLETGELASPAPICADAAARGLFPASRRVAAAQQVA
ncbi:MAG TPA: radical SAM protein [bacterium]|nr:radical SAM protein [bacterium]